MTRWRRRSGPLLGPGSDSAWLRLLGLMLMLSAVALALSRAPDRPVTSLVDRWAPHPSDFLELHGQLVHLRDEGPAHDPTPLVLLHGLAGSLHTWEPWVRELRRHRRVLRIDLPGYGLTGPLAGRYQGEDYRAAAYLPFVLDLLDALQVRQAVLIGHGLGGEVAWHLAAQAPQRVSQLVLISPSGLPYTPEQVPLALRLAALPGVGALGQWFLPRALVTQSMASVWADPGRLRSEQVDRCFELMLREGNRTALRHRLHQSPPGHAPMPMPPLSLPTLILWGAQDRFAPPAVAAQVQAAVAGSTLQWLPGLGHVPHEEDPVASLPPLLGFLGVGPGAATLP